jgi:mono/diheme cytochrome c family protein
MKKFLKILGILVLILIVGVIAGIIYFNSKYPDVDPAPEITVISTPEKIARGEYLANHVALCIDCHSERDWSLFAGPVTPGTEGQGGDIFDENMGFPGTIVSKNITPAALGTWSDGEIIRALTCGVNKDGTALFPLMPYPNLRQMSEEDIHSIVAYIRTLEAKENALPNTELNFPLNFIVKTIPFKQYEPLEPVNKADAKAYGKYLFTAASCNDCHTQAVEGVPVEGMELAGGTTFNTPWGVLKSANITPDNETGIGTWTKEFFVQRFKAYDPDSIAVVSVGPNEFNTIMPWIMYAGMTQEDIGAIYEYLMSVKPIKNKVTHFTPAEEIAQK